jgi:hypothetical protein
MSALRRQGEKQEQYQRLHHGPHMACVCEVSR